MEGKSRTGTEVPQAELPTVHLSEEKARRTTRWLVGAVVVLALAVVALGVALIVEPGAEEAPPQGPALVGPASPEAQAPVGLASAEVVKMLTDRIDALNRGDAEAVGAFFSDDAVLEEHDQRGRRYQFPAYVSKGREEITRRFEQGVAAYFTLKRESEVIQIGPFVAEAVSGPGGWRGILVYKLDKDLKILHEWVIG